MDELKTQYEEAKASKSILSGNLQFESDFISSFQLYSATVKWIEKDENVQNATVRSGGPDRLVIDFSYELSGDMFGQGKAGKGPGTRAIIEKVTPFFENEFGANYLKWWDISIDAIIVK